MKTNNVAFLFIEILLTLGCCKKERCEDCNLDKINPNIISLDKKYYFSRCAEWIDNNQFYTVGPIRNIQTDSSFNITKDTLLAPYGSYYIESNNSGNKILFVQSKFSDVSEGALKEYDIVTGQFVELFDSTYNISSAVYYRGDDSIIYYTYGKPFYNNPGYFLYNRSTGESTKILEYLAQIEGPEAEMVNGFDIHPTKNILLIPAVRRARSPLIIQYNMEKKVMDTLDINFDFSFNRICLWLRYNKVGDKVLYSCYPEYAGTSTTNDDSEIGIIDLTSMEKRVLDVNTNSGGTFRSVNVFPNWSPDGRHIVYGSGKLSIEGARGTYHLYILKNVY
jgi:hypothetical protein